MRLGADPRAQWAGPLARCARRARALGAVPTNRRRALRRRIAAKAPFGSAAPVDDKHLAVLRAAPRVAIERKARPAKGALKAPVVRPPFAAALPAEARQVGRQGAVRAWARVVRANARRRPAGSRGTGRARTASAAPPDLAYGIAQRASA